MEINLEAIESRRKQIMAELERAVGTMNYLRGCLAELQTMEDYLKTAVVSQEEIDDQKIHAV